MRSTPRTASWALLVFLAGSGSGGAAQPSPLPADQLSRLAAVGSDLRDVTMAPTGRRVAWTEAETDADGGPTGSTVIRVADLESAESAGIGSRHSSRTAGSDPPARSGKASDARNALTPAKVTTVGTVGRRWTPAGGAGGAHAVGAPGPPSRPAYGPAWAPDGRRLAFLAESPGAADVPAGQPQIWVAGDDLSLATELTHLLGSIESLLWSPDGRQIAFLFGGLQSGPSGLLEAAAPAGGLIGEKQPERHLASLDLATGAVRLVSPPGLFVFEFDWAPDGRSFVALATRGDGDAAWWTAEIYLIAGEPPGRRPWPVAARQAGAREQQGAALPVDTGQARLLFKPPLQAASPRFSPDGRAVAFIGGLMSDQGGVGGDIYLLPLTGGEATDLTPGLAASAAWLAWTSAGEIVFAETVDGACGIAKLDVRTRAISTLWTAPQFVSTGGAAVGLALARNGRTAAAVLQSFASPPEVWAGPIGGWRPLTQRHASVRPAWGEARSLHWQGDAGTVQGWLLAPPSSFLEGGPGRLHPLVVLVHGGPAGAIKSAWPGVSGALANHGFYVLMPNPRGSYGAGEAFTRANVGDFGHGDLRDILGGIDAALAQAPIDRARVGIYGWSYGGFMAMWAVTQTDRFRAAVAGAGVANWQSYYGETGYSFLIPYFGATPYADPQAYARSSPLTFITRVKTPTLILQGERDAEVPAAQALEFWQALKTLGVETQLMLYPDEGHRLGPASDRDRLRRILAWFAAHLQ